ncbi:MAG: 2,3-bisphosphoglycerate-independent phosphoglycerate mutase [Thermodesulfovibrionales bacterium]
MKQEISERLLIMDLIKSLIQKNERKIVFVVLDGLGGLPVNGKTELDAARKPNLDNLARISACGLHVPVFPGITPGSGPGHLGLFGYEPLRYQIGRGVLESLGLGLELTKRDIAIRANYATLKKGIIVDRRAGRIPTSESAKLTGYLSENIKEIEGVEIIFKPGMEHRFAIVLRFPEVLKEGADSIMDTDPQKEGREPLPVRAQRPEAEGVAVVIEKLLNKMIPLLREQEKANYVLLRGISMVPDIPDFGSIYGLRPLCIATYPMYRGLARLIGMDIVDIKGDIPEEIETLKEHYDKYDFFFVHIKKVDSYGEDGNFEGKVKKIEEFDNVLSEILNLKPDVLVITGDHSTPSLLKSHSWHPVPVLLYSSYVLGGLSSAFTERECAKGELGIFPTVYLMSLVLANSLRLKKFGA